ITADWDGDRGLHALFFTLVASGRFSLEGLNTHTFAPDDAKTAYRTATERRADTMGILFDWRREERRAVQGVARMAYELAANVEILFTEHGTGDEHIAERITAAAAAGLN